MFQKDCSAAAGGKRCVTAQFDLSGLRDGLQQLPCAAGQFQSVSGTCEAEAQSVK